jgi:predicted oxidoreductase
VRFLPAVGWAERGGGLATGHGNSVPRFHLVWGTGPALVAPFARLVLQGVACGLVHPLFRHRVDGLHGHRSLEGTFLGACLHTGRQVAHTLASAVR